MNRAMNRMGAGAMLAAWAAASCAAAAENWYQRSFYLLHEDHHTRGDAAVGAAADPEETARLVALSDPDVVQIHAKGNPGWTTFPSRVGHTPPKLARDVLGLWRDIARRQGRAFSVYFNLGRDGEIMKRRPEWNRQKADGSLWDRALCYHSGVAQAYLWPMIDEILARYEPDGFWFDGSCFTVTVCYERACRERFLRETGMAPPRGPSEPGWAAYKEMQRRIYREMIRDTARRIHQRDPDCLVAVNWAYALRMPEKPDPGIAYLTGDLGDRVERLSPEAHWYDSTGWPFDLMTTVHTLEEPDVERPGAEPGASRRMGNKPAEQIQQEIAVIIANGGRYFAWDNPTPESGLIAERHEFLAAAVAPFLRSRQPWCQGSERTPDVSLLHAAADHYAITDELPVCFPPIQANNRISGSVDRLQRLHLNYEFLPDWRLAEQEVRGRLVVVEHPKRLSEQTIDALVRWVRAGGRLLLTGQGVTLDERLAELCGAAEVEAPRGPEPLTLELGGRAVAVRHWLYRFQPDGAAVVLEAADAAGRRWPLLCRRRFGRGAAWYAALPLLSRHGRETTPLEVVRAVFDRVLPPSERLAATDAPETVELVVRRQGERRVVHLVNLAPGRRRVLKAGGRPYVRITQIPPAPPARVWVAAPRRPRAVALQPQNRPLDGWSWENGRLELPVPGFAIHQMVVVE